MVFGLWSTLLLAASAITGVSALAIERRQYDDGKYYPGKYDNAESNDGPQLNTTATGQTVAYFGQTKRQDNDGLAKVCSDPSVDIVVLAFMHILRGTGGLPGSDFWPYCNDKVAGTELSTCSDWGSIIETCQDNGKKVLLSIGGATMTQSLAGDQDAITLANQVWGLFGEGTGYEEYRPFGATTLDGFDLDIENNNPTGWPKFISEMRAKYENASKEYYLTAAPQCPKPDASIGDAVYLVDYIFVQFYNNPGCQASNMPASFSDWSQDIAARSTVGTKVFAGFAGATDAVGGAGGYISPSAMTGYVAQVKGLENYGGIMTWDYALANNNVVNGQTFLQAMKAAA